MWNQLLKFESKLARKKLRKTSTKEKTENREFDDGEKCYFMQWGQ